MKMTLKYTRYDRDEKRGQKWPEDLFAVGGALNICQSIQTVSLGSAHQKPEPSSIT